MLKVSVVERHRLSFQKFLVTESLEDPDSLGDWCRSLVEMHGQESGES